ncbi:MAG TPA: sigma-54 dependent transcriptional regulator [Terracidiphilus sp.]|nr:sigma-54 dependent transcriptional regulator [Terracidiphilus sp.]
MKVLDKRRQHIAILDPNPDLLDYMGQVLSEGFKVSLFSEVDEFRHGLEQGMAPDLLLMDWHAEDKSSGNESAALLGSVRAARPSMPVVVLACSADLTELLAATRLGASEILLKPFRKSDLESVVSQCLEALPKKEASEETKEIPLNETTSFVRCSRRMQEIESQCTLVARADIPVLILGESGTGKEVAAMLIHKMSARSQRNFLKVNCAAMPADLLESELFGYEQGAFTGAVKAKPGKFELCDNGTIFLDEIGEMPAVLQAKLLQVLQDGSFSRLGSRTTVKVDVRVIAATNIDIKDAIARKSFREDLYYRLNGFTVKMPPLRERSQEIPILAGHFMRKSASRYGCEPLPISTALMQALTHYSWPGNLRELENTVKRYLVLRDESEIIGELTPAHVGKAILSSAEASDGGGSLKVLVKSLKGNAEAAAIAQTLEGTGWNRKAAANDLQISYKALLYKIKQYNLSPPQKQHSFN